MALTRITKGVIKPNENYDTHNINSTGIVTAVGADFSGNVSIGGVLTYEDVTSIDSVGIITARDGIDCNGDLDVDGHTNLDNVSVAGVTTFAGAITAPDIITAGALLHEGDTNTLVHFSANDTIQLKTGGSSRLLINNSGLNLENGYFNTNGNRIILGDSTGATDDRIVFGNSNDCFIYHDSTNTFIENNTGTLKILGNIIQLGEGDDNVGIGTDDPQVKLHLNMSSGGLPKIRLQHVSAGNDTFEITGGIAGVSNGGFGIYDVDESAYRFVINSAGNVGIGSETPQEQLDVAGNINATGTLGSDNITITSTTPTINFVDTNTNPDFRIVRSANGLFIQDTTNGNADRFQIKNDGTVVIAGNLDCESGIDVTGKLRIDISSTGGVGSGTAEGIFLRNTNETDNNAVTIFGGADDYNSAASAINFINIDHSENYGAISFDTRGAGGYVERVRIDNSGNMQVSTGQFTVGTTATTGLQFINDGTFGTLHSADLTFRTASTPRMTLDTSGNVGINSTSPQAQFVLSRSLSVNHGIEMGYSSGNSQHFIQAYNRGTSAFTKLIVNNSLTVDSDGKVGIGTDDPAAKLEVRAQGNTQGGIFITDSTFSQAAPYLRVLGKRSDGNTHQNFSGRVLLASLRTNAKVGSGKKVGTIMFGGNHTDASESNILYAASIAGVAGDSFDSATDMPTDLVFYTGSTGRTPEVSNVSSGEERLRITSAGEVKINFAAAGQTVLSCEGLYDGGSNTSVDIATFARQGNAVKTAIRYNDPTTSMRFGTTTAHDFGLMTHGTERLHVSSVGKVGIGTDNPVAKVEIAAVTTNVQGYSDGQVQIVANNPIAFVSQSNLNPALNRWGFKLASQNDGDFSIYDYRHSSNRLLINSSGKVGIGTNDPQTQLDVRGSSSASITIGLNNGTKYGNFSCDNSATYLYGYNGNDIIFSTHTANSFNRKATLTNYGRLAVGPEDTPTTQLYVGISSNTQWSASKNVSNTTNLDFLALDLINTNNDTNSEVGLMMEAGSSSAAQMTISTKKVSANYAELVIRTRDGGSASKEIFKLTGNGTRYVRGGATIDITGGSESASITPSNGDYIDFARVNYAHGAMGEIFIKWTSVQAPGCCHHGATHIRIGSNHLTYFYGWNDWIDIVSSQAHNDAWFSHWRLRRVVVSGTSFLYLQGKWNGSTVNSGSFQVTIGKTAYHSNGSGTVEALTPVIDNNENGDTSGSKTYGQIQAQVQGKREADSPATTGDRITKSHSGRFHAYMGLDTQGEISAYNQPRMSANKNAGQTYTTTPNIVTYGNEHFDNGNDYNDSTHKFTCPMDGVYYVSYSANISASSNWGYLECRVNGSAAFTHARIMHYDFPRLTFHGSNYCNCAQGDEIAIYAWTNSGTLSGDNFGLFQVYMLS